MAKLSTTTVYGDLTVTGKINGVTTDSTENEELIERQEELEWRMSRLETFNLGDAPSSKLMCVLGVIDGRFGYWDKERLVPTNIENAKNWFDNGVFSDCQKPEKVV